MAQPSPLAFPDLQIYSWLFRVLPQQGIPKETQYLAGLKHEVCKNSCNRITVSHLLDLLGSYYVYVTYVM